MAYAAHAILRFPVLGERGIILRKDLNFSIYPQIAPLVELYHSFTLSFTLSLSKGCRGAAKTRRWFRQHFDKLNARLSRRLFEFLDRFLDDPKGVYRNVPTCFPSNIS